LAQTKAFNEQTSLSTFLGNERENRKEKKKERQGERVKEGGRRREN